MTNDTGSKVSIIIPTKNDAVNIKEALDSLIENNVFSKNVEVIVVDGHSTDDTVRIASNYPLTIYYESVGTRAGACNIGWRNSNGDIIVFTDADCLFLKGWIPKIVNSFHDPKVAAVGGIDLTPPASTSYFEMASGLLDEISHYHFLRKNWHGLAFNLRGCNVAYRKSALIKSSGFDDKFRTGEESELQYRLHKMGYKLIFDPSIVVYHKRRSSPKKYWKQFYQYGYGKFQLIQKHPPLLFLPEIFIPPFITLLFCFSTIISLLDKTFLPLLYAAFLVPLVYVGYITFKIYTSKKLYASKRSVRLLPGVITALIIRNIAMVIGFFIAFYQVYKYLGRLKR